MELSRRQLVTGMSGILACSHLGVQAVADVTRERWGLLLIMHGSPRRPWTEKALAFAENVTARADALQIFHAVDFAFLEFSEPYIAQAIERLQQAGCSRIVAVPVFVMIGHHTLFDVPAALGIYYSHHALEHLQEEKIPIAKPQIPIVYTSTLDDGDLLERFSLEQIQRLSSQPSKEGVVILVHGDAEQRPLIEQRLRRLMVWCSCRSGIAYFDYVCVGIGQGFEHHAVPVILNALKHCSRVLVIALYVGLSAENILNYARARSENLPSDLLGEKVVFSNLSLIEYPPVIDFILEHASHALELWGHGCNHSQT